MLRSWFLNIILQLKEQELLGEVVEFRAGKYKMSLDDLLVFRKLKSAQKMDRAC